MYTLIEYLEETHSSKNLLEMFQKHSLLLIVKCRTKTLFSHDFWLLLSIPYVCWSVSNCPQSWIDFFVVPPHYFSMLLTIGDLNNAQIICFHFPPPPPLQRKNFFAFLLLHGLLHKLAFNSKSVMGLQFFEGFCWGTKLFSNLQEICQKNEPWCRTTFQTCNSFSATIIVFNSCSQFDIQCQVHGWREENHY